MIAGKRDGAADKRIDPGPDGHAQTIKNHLKQTQLPLEPNLGHARPPSLHYPKAPPTRPTHSRSVNRFGPPDRAEPLGMSEGAPLPMKMSRIIEEAGEGVPEPASADCRETRAYHRAHRATQRDHLLPGPAPGRGDGRVFPGPFFLEGIKLGLAGSAVGAL